MGLDATVYCDCFERDKLNTPPDPAWRVEVDATGARFAKTAELEHDLAFDQWNCAACAHDDGVLLHHRLGNISTIGLIRTVLSESAPLFPLILTRVIYSGSHCGDHVPYPLVPELSHEVELLAQVQPREVIAAECVRDFERKLRELIAAAMQVRKPIAF